MIGEHKNVVLQFSGGKDSLACLYLLRPWWEHITVMWVNTGDAFPETAEQMDAVADMVPRFMEVRSDALTMLREHGPPSDLVSVWDTPLGHSVMDGRTYKVRPTFDCCRDNIWLPMQDVVKALGATLVIRGQRNAERAKSPIRSGHKDGGVEYLFPIEDWSSQQVRDYLKEQGAALPRHYDYVDTSLDCQHCTGYLFENAGKFEFIRQHHPALHVEVQGQLRQIYLAAQNEMSHLTRVMRT